MKLSEILGWPEKQPEETIDSINTNPYWPYCQAYGGNMDYLIPENKGYNTALESCDRETDVKELAYIILEFYENECADDAMDIHRLSDRIISTMPTWLKPTERK